MASPTLEQILIAFRAQVLSASDVSDKIGTRFYLTHANENPQLPYAVYNIGDHSISSNHSGQSGVQIVEIDVEVFAADEAQALKLCDAVRASVQGFSGAVNGTHLNRVIYGGASDFAHAEQKYYGWLLDFTIHA